MKKYKYNFPEVTYLELKKSLQHCNEIVIFSSKEYKSIRKNAIKLLSDMSNLYFQNRELNFYQDLYLWFRKEKFTELSNAYLKESISLLISVFDREITSNETIPFNQQENLISVLILTLETLNTGIFSPELNRELFQDIDEHYLLKLLSKISLTSSQRKADIKKITNLINSLHENIKSKAIAANTNEKGYEINTTIAIDTKCPINTSSWIASASSDELESALDEFYIYSKQEKESIIKRALNICPDGLLFKMPFTTFWFMMENPDNYAISIDYALLKFKRKDKYTKENVDEFLKFTETKDYKEVYSRLMSFISSLKDINEFTIKLIDEILCGWISRFFKGNIKKELNLLSDTTKHLDMAKSLCKYDYLDNLKCTDFIELFENINIRNEILWTWNITEYVTDKNYIPSIVFNEETNSWVFMKSESLVNRLDVCSYISLYGSEYEQKLVIDIIKSVQLTKDLLVNINSNRNLEFQQNKNALKLLTYQCSTVKAQISLFITKKISNKLLSENEINSFIDDNFTGLLYTTPEIIQCFMSEYTDDVLSKWDFRKVGQLDKFVDIIDNIANNTNQANYMHKLDILDLINDALCKKLEVELPIKYKSLKKICSVCSTADSPIKISDLIGK